MYEDVIDPAVSESHRREETEETIEDRVTGGRPVLWLLVTGNRVAALCWVWPSRSLGSW